MNLYTHATADVSPCQLYRWTLEREWVPKENARGGTVAFVMLNPSTADGTKDDPTIRRCVGFGKSWGFSRLLVVNLFPFRCTEPKGLLTANDPTGGTAGDKAMMRCLSADAIIAAWGSWVPFERDKHAIRGLSCVRRLHCLGTTKDGHPRHPLYVKAEQQPVYFG